MTLYLIIAFKIAQALPLNGGEIKYEPIACYEDARVTTTSDAKAAQDAVEGGGVVFSITASKKGINVAQIIAQTKTVTSTVAVPTLPKPEPKKPEAPKK